MKRVKEFLHEHYQVGKPVLLGFSGGPDSLALLHLLLELGVDLVVAHVDHGWRQESREEARALEEYVRRLGLEFHGHRLENLAPKENVARDARWKFLQQVCGERGCQAVVLGHHGDDQAETVLKRVFEGGALGGMKEVSTRDGVKIWRPLLSWRKSEIQEWLQERGLKGLEDATNLDPKYLRGRMRVSILPDLAEKFGKNIIGNLCRLGRAAQELEEYLEKRILHWNLQDEFVAFSEEIEPVEIKFFLKKWAEQHGFFLSHDQVQTVCLLLQQNAVQKRVGPLLVHGRTLALKKD